MTFREFALTCGAILPDDITPGKWRDCRTVDKLTKKKASFILDPDGQTGTVKDWRTGEVHFWRANGQSAAAKVPAESFRAIQARQQSEKAAQEAATRAAQRYYDRAFPLTGPVPYLTGKELGVEGCSEIRCTTANELVVPMYLNGRLSSVQRILPDGSKLFWTGAPTKGAAFRINRRRSSTTLFCEGVATGLLLFSAIPDSSVIVCFSANNLARVVKSASPCGMVCICADNDHETEARTGKNPGVATAKEAAELTGAGLAVPDCRGSDWLDLFQERMQTLRDDNSLSKWKRRPADIRAAALAEVRLAVVSAARFIPWAAPPPPRKVMTVSKC